MEIYQTKTNIHNRNLRNTRAVLLIIFKITYPNLNLHWYSESNADRNETNRCVLLFYCSSRLKISKSSRFLLRGDKINFISSSLDTSKIYLYRCSSQDPDY